MKDNETQDLKRNSLGTNTLGSEAASETGSAAGQDIDQLQNLNKTKTYLDEKDLPV